MEKINDIHKNLNENIEIKSNYIEKNIKISIKKNNNTNDIFSKSNKTDNNINLEGKKYIKIKKNKRKIFDSVLKNRNLKTLNLIKKPLFQRISLKIKHILKIFRNKELKINIINFFNFKLYITNFIYSKNKTKKIGFFLLFIIIIAFFNKIIIENQINKGYEKLLSLKTQQTDIFNINKTLNSAKNSFLIANILYKPFLLIPNNNIKNGYYILQGGKSTTFLLIEIVNLYVGIKSNINLKEDINNIEFTKILSNNKDNFQKITGLLYKTIINFEKINNLKNEKVNNKLENILIQLKGLYKNINIINQDYEIFLSLLGDNTEKEYLILFQNNDEIRATGGFIGSLGTIIIKNGKIINFNKEDVYSYEWDINKNYKDRLNAPEGLNEITKYFGLRDSNYYPSFEKSSNQIKFFLNKIDKNVDGIIYLNQNIVLDFLESIGGVEFEQIGKNINKNNFSLIISTLVEAKSFKIGTLGTPKQILFDFSLSFFDKLKNDKDYISYLKIIIKNIKTRDLVFYSFNSEENNLLWKLGMNGKIDYSKTIDYNYPVYTSIGGNKSDRYIEIKYEKNIKKNIDCSIDTNLNIYRTHLFSKKEEKEVNYLLDHYPIKYRKKTDIINIQGRGTNRVYIRVLLPKNIIVKEKKGMKIKQENNKTQVSFYMDTRLSESTSFNISYKILNTNCKEYNFKLYKQPGIKKYDIEIFNGVNSTKEININNDYIY